MWGFEDYVCSFPTAAGGRYNTIPLSAFSSAQARRTPHLPPCLHLNVTPTPAQVGAVAFVKAVSVSTCVCVCVCVLVSDLGSGPGTWPRCAPASDRTPPSPGRGCHRNGHQRRTPGWSWYGNSRCCKRTWGRRVDWVRGGMNDLKINVKYEWKWEHLHSRDTDHNSFKD